jgi:hypothetical protein
VTASQTLETSASSSPSSSASVSSPSGNAGMAVSHTRGFTFSLVLSVAGVGWWLL